MQIVSAKESPRNGVPGYMAARPRNVGEVSNLADVMT